MNKQEQPMNNNADIRDNPARNNPKAKNESGDASKQKSAKGDGCGC
jgi:hypothetical protein